MITFKVTLLNADSVVDEMAFRHSKRGTKITNKTVPVTLGYRTDSKSVLGNAKLSWEGTRLVAEITITNEAFEKAVDDLYPSASGVYTGKNDEKSNGCYINGVALTPERNVDHRIKTVRQQLRSEITWTSQTKECPTGCTHDREFDCEKSYVG